MITRLSHEIFCNILGVKKLSADGQGDGPEGPEPGRAQLWAGQLHVHPLPSGAHSCRPRSGTTSGHSSFRSSRSFFFFSAVPVIPFFRVIPVISRQSNIASTLLVLPTVCSNVAHSLERRLIIMLNRAEMRYIFFKTVWLKNKSTSITAVRDQYPTS